MDAVELGRQVAADLHQQAVLRGVDPWRPLEFVLAEASRREIDVEPIAPGAALLNNGRATFIPEDQIILYENAGSAFEKAFLIAHEIGHAELGDDDESGTALEIDLARTAEPSPTGMDRVVDYGRRQKREVQMDLFAREFLIPRPVVRRLHLVDGLSASAIAEQLGAPFEVVAQQLFDALLLPTVERKEHKTQTERAPNDLQRHAANHRGVAFLLEAGPGTGKTQTLIARVESLLADGVDPRRILLLTFSNKAAGEMAERIAAKRRDAAAAMWIGTFHSFGLDIIRRFYTELGLPSDPRLLDRTEAVELLEEQFPRLDLVHYRNLYDPTQIIADILAAISRAKDEVIDDAQYATLADEMLRVAASPEECAAAERASEVARVYKVYEQLKRQADCIDFGDLVSRPVQLLETNRGVLEQLREQYDHVLVDEYQDVNRSSVRLLSALCGDGNDLWVVGDAKQSIYRFRGASSFNISRFGNEDFPGAARGRLKRNYRSVGEIVEAFSSFAIGMKAGDADSGLESERENCGSLPEILTVDRAEHQTVKLADTIDAMVRAGYTFSDQAVLCTGNDKLSSIGRDLERLGIPVLFLGSLFERPEVKDLLSLLSILVDRRAMGLVRLACWPEFKMSMQDLSSVLDYLRGELPAPATWLRTSDIPSLSEQGRAAVAALASALDQFDETASPWHVLAKVLLDRTRIAAQIASVDNVVHQTRGIAIWQLLNFVRAPPAGQGFPIVRLLDRIRRLVRLGDDRDLRQLPTAAQGIDAMRLMTIHGAKGLEFPVVHVPNLNADTLPRNSTSSACPPPDGMVQGGAGASEILLKAAHAEEQECLFYVALSRARDRLFLYAATQKANGHTRAVSPFVGKIEAACLRQHGNSSRDLPRAAEEDDILLDVQDALRFSSQQIELYERCPRRFFYTYILQIGGRRKATAFMMMHEAVRTVSQRIIDNPTSDVDETSLHRHLQEAFVTHGLGEHGYIEQYRNMAIAMVKYFVETRAGHTPESPAAVQLMFGNEQIVVRADEVLLRSDGTRALRRIRTGHQRSSEGKDVAAAAFVLAAQQAFPGAVIELVYLSDQVIQPIALSQRELQTRSDKLGRFLGDIRAGRFPGDASTRTCPACPAFFVCGPTPAGPLKKVF